MSRELKFMAWDGVKMRLAFDLTQNPKVWWEENKDFPLLQYTGLKDKNGKEIYEGNILCINDDATAPMDIVYDITKTLHLQGYIERGVPVEIVGNIYENKDLLV